jgi:hypothetical protein
MGIDWYFSLYIGGGLILGLSLSSLIKTAFKKQRPKVFPFLGLSLVLIGLIFLLHNRLPQPQDMMGVMVPFLFCTFLSCIGNLKQPLGLILLIPAILFFFFSLVFETQTLSAYKRPFIEIDQIQGFTQESRVLIVKNLTNSQLKTLRLPNEAVEIYGFSFTAENRFLAIFFPPEQRFLPEIEIQTSTNSGRIFLKPRRDDLFHKIFSSIPCNFSKTLLYLLAE